MSSVRIAALAVSATLLAAAGALAGPKPVPPPDPSVAPAVAELHKIVALLNGADHDYQGHRAEAIHFVHKAIHALHPHHKVVAPGTTTAPKSTTPKEPAVKEAQAKSDAQLKLAMQALLTLQAQLSSSTAAHHKKAAAEIQGALAELNTALAIK